MRRNVRTLLELTQQHLGLPEPIVGLGCYHAPGLQVNADLRQLFQGKHFIGCNVRVGLDVDRVEDTGALTFASGSVGSVVMMETLEHVRDCRSATSEVYRVLRPGGVVVASSVTDLTMDDQPADHWRFAPDAYKDLFENFGQTLVGYQGDLRQPHTVFAVSVKDPSKNMGTALARIQESFYRRHHTLYWQALQVRRAFRDLIASVRGESNQMDFEMLSQSIRPSAETSDKVPETHTLTGQEMAALSEFTMRPMSVTAGYSPQSLFGENLTPAGLRQAQSPAAGDMDEPIAAQRFHQFEQLRPVQAIFAYLREQLVRRERRARL